jgi:hypothetical protein
MIHLAIPVVLSGGVTLPVHSRDCENASAMRCAEFPALVPAFCLFQ